MGRQEALEAWANDRLAALGLDPVQLPPRPASAIVGFDGHPSAEGAAEWAHQIAETVHLVTVLPKASVYRTKPTTSREIKEETRSIRQHVSRALEDLRERLPQARFEHHTIKGSPMRSLSEAIETHDAELIAAGARNPERTPESPFGSVGEGLLHQARISTLLSRARPGQGPIIVAIGDDPGTRWAAGWGTAIAAWLDRPLVLAHAGRPGEVRGFEAKGPNAEATWVDWPPRFGLAELLGDDPGALAVFGHEAGDAWLGSTAIQLARTTRCSILIARPA